MGDVDSIKSVLDAQAPLLESNSSEVANIASNTSQLVELEPEPKLFGELRDKFDLYAKFWRTRKAVFTGEFLYQLTPKDLETRQLMGPWTFNATQSSIVAILGSAISWALTQHFPLLYPDAESSGHLSPLVQEWFSRIHEFLEAGIAPFVLLYAAKYTARASFLPGDETPYGLSRNTTMYLYWDGAYGLIPQFLFVAFLAMVGISSVRKSHHYIDISFVSLLDFFWQFYLSLRMYSGGLFRLNGYEVVKGRGRPVAPCFRYTMKHSFWLGAFTALLSIGVTLLSLLLGAVAVLSLHWLGLAPSSSAQ